MKGLIFTLMLLAVLPFASQAQITVDGDPSDWTGTPSSTIHGTTISNNQWIYTGTSGDRRTDAGMTDDADLTEVRFGTDGTSLFGLIKVANLSTPSNFHAGLSIGYTTGGTRNYTWIGAVSNGNSGSMPLGAGGSQLSERNIDIHWTGSGLSIEMWDNGTPPWYAPPGINASSQIAYSTTYNCVEFSISLADLGTNNTATLYITLVTFMNQQGNSGSWWNNDGDGNTTKDYYMCDGVDAMTPGSATGNAWNRDLNDGNAGFYGSIPLSMGILPVQLTSFSGLAQPEGVRLQWETANESQFSQYEIERSDDGQSFMKIAAVSAENSPSGASYEYLDQNPLSGTAYYRLKMIENDGSYSYSDIVSVTINPAIPQIQLYPNPASDMVKVYTPGKATGILIFNANGDLVCSVSPASGYGDAYLLTTKDLPNGVYEVVVLLENGRKTNKELVLSR